MNKLIEHIKANSAVYLVVFATIVIVSLLLFRKPTEEKTKEAEIEYDTSMFNVVDAVGANKLFTQNQDQLLFIGRKTCGVCQYFIKAVQIAMAKGNFYVSYLDIEEVDINSNDYKEFVEKLDYEYTYEGVTAPIGHFMGATPMVIIIKDNKIVFGTLGSYSSDALVTLTKQYGINRS